MILGIKLLLSHFPHLLKGVDLYMNWGGHNSPVWLALA